MKGDSMSVTGYEIKVNACGWTFGRSDFHKFTEKAAALAAAGLFIETGTIELPGECDAQRASRLERELTYAKADIERLERRAKNLERAAKATKRSKPAVARVKSK